MAGKKITLEIDAEDCTLFIEAFRSYAMHLYKSSEEASYASDGMRETWKENATKLDKVRFRLQETQNG